MFIDTDKNFCYIAIPKTGTYSVYDYFGNNADHPEPLLHHLSADILDNGRHTHQLGGIANIARALQTPQFLDYDLSFADVKINRQDQSATAEVKWGRHVPFDWRFASWYHISYLNTIDNLEDFAFGMCDHPISADFCSIEQHGLGQSRDFVSKIDYIFMSRGEACDYFSGKVPYNIAKIATIIHDAHCVDVHCSTESCDTHRPELGVKNGPMNTLGAGDTFVAGFIDSMLDDDVSIITAVRQAYSRAKRYVENQND